LKKLSAATNNFEIPRSRNVCHPPDEFARTAGLLGLPGLGITAARRHTK
jgi:hypothetical protein